MKAARRGVAGLAALAAVLLASPWALADEELHDLDTYARVDADHVVLGNDLVESRWSRAPFVTEDLRDKRRDTVWSAASADFAVTLAGAVVPSSLLAVAGVELATLPRRGVRVTFRLTPLGSGGPVQPPLPAGLEMVRVAEVYPGIAGFRFETTLRSAAPLAISAYAVAQLMPPLPVAPTMHSFRAGADWRTPEWAGPPFALGEPHGGTWRVSRSAATGEAIGGTAQWMSLLADGGARAFLVLERNDYASSQMAYDGARAYAEVDLSRDVIYLGPIEEQGHLENPLPSPLPGRMRVVAPDRPLRLEAVFLGFGRDADDEPWQHHRYLVDHRMPPYAHAVVFNSNGVDQNRISTGAKDDMDFDEFQRQLAVARELGIETFVFDDGWQARSGDWCPDSPECPEPRWDGSDISKFKPRFPDARFAAVREKLAADPARGLAGLDLGLWMSPMHFNPSSMAFQQNPQWACLPVSLGLVALNLAQPDSGSNEAGLGTWNPEAIAVDGRKLIDYIESRLRTAIGEWGVRYFKFDFLVWLDCLGLDPVDLYAYRESFLAMLDRLIADHPAVTFEIDETNDYRLFPFESVARGPSWYQNGSPTPRQALHASWTLSPFVPTFSLGRDALGGSALDAANVDLRMAAALVSHMTFFRDLTGIAASLRPRIRAWVDYYAAHRGDLAGVTYPLLDDPISGDGWTAFQPWNPETGRGFLLIFRQDSPDAVHSVALRNVPPGRTFRLLEGPEETIVTTKTSAELTAGIAVTIASPNGARVLRIEPES